MNNSQFRNLLQKDDKSGSSGAENGSLKKPTLGSRGRAFMPMTPRSLMGRSSTSAFAKQVGDHTQNADGEPPAKRFKSAAAPRGTKLAQVY